MAVLDVDASERALRRSADDVAIAGIDTRRLTRHLRDHGAQNGCIMSLDSAREPTQQEIGQAIAAAKAAPSMAGQALAQVVTCTEPYSWTQTEWVLGEGYGNLDEPEFHVVAYDYGVKHNILRMLAGRGCKLTVVPAQTPAAEVLALNPDGVFRAMALATRNPAITPLPPSATSLTVASRPSASAWVTSCWRWPAEPRLTR